MTSDSKQLPKLFARMAELTAPVCRSTCRAPHSCCSAEYCDMAIDTAKADYGVDLPRTEHARLPLMGGNGCTAAPHFRPLCTLHVCSINGIGSSGDVGWDRTYFRLRAQIEAAAADAL